MAAPLHHTILNNTFWVLPQMALYWEEQKAIIISDLHLGKTGHFRKEGIAVPQAIYKDDLHRLFHIIQYYKPEQLIIAGDMFHSHMNKEVDLFTRWRNDVSHLHIQLIKGNHDILLDGHYSAAGITVTLQFLHVGKFCFVHDIGDVGKTESPEDGNTVHSPLPIAHSRKALSVNRQSSIANRQSPIGNRQPETGNQQPVTCNLQPATSILQPVTSNPLYYFSGHIHPGIALQTGMRQSMRFPCYYFTAGYAVLPAFSAFSGMYCVSPKKTDRVFAIVNGAVIKFGK